MFYNVILLINIFQSPMWVWCTRICSCQTYKSFLKAVKKKKKNLL